MEAISYLETQIQLSKPGLFREFCINVLKFLNKGYNKEYIIKSLNAHLDKCDLYTLEFSEVLRKVKGLIK